MLTINLKYDQWELLLAVKIEININYHRGWKPLPQPNDTGRIGNTLTAEPATRNPQLATRFIS
jgi:hypothetical protein